MGSSLERCYLSSGLNILQIIPKKVVFEEICKFIFKYNKLPTQEVLRVEVDSRSESQ